MAFDSPSGGPTRFGYGDTDLSFKYRFIQEDKEGSRPKVAVFPLVQSPTGDENRGLGAGHVLAFLPIWVQKSFGDWTTYGGGGYWMNQGGVGDKNYWFFGGLLQRKVTDKLSIAGEIFHQTANAIDGDDSTGFTMSIATCCSRLVEASKTPTIRMCSPGTWATKLPGHSKAHQHAVHAARDNRS